MEVEDGFGEDADTNWIEEGILNGVGILRDSVPEIGCSVGIRHNDAKAGGLKVKWSLECLED